MFTACNSQINCTSWRICTSAHRPATPKQHCSHHFPSYHGGVDASPEEPPASRRDLTQHAAHFFHQARPCTPAASQDPLSMASRSSLQQEVAAHAEPSLIAALLADVLRLRRAGAAAATGTGAASPAAAAAGCFCISSSCFLTCGRCSSRSSSSAKPTGMLSATEHEARCRCHIGR